MKFVREGNFIYPVRVILFCIGVAIVLISFICVASAIWSKIGISIGLLFAAIGGYSSQAHMLGLKPFDIAPWKRAKATYRETETTQETNKSIADFRAAGKPDGQK